MNVECEKVVECEVHTTDNASHNSEVDSGPIESLDFSLDEWDLVQIQPGNAEMSVESALLWCLNPAIYGIKSIGVQPATERAKKLIDSCDGDTSAAVALASGTETGGIKRTRIIFEFLIRQVPLVGCPAYILTSTWTHLRAVATIAAIYGHDLDKPRTQHEILWCLLPTGSADSDESSAVVTTTSGEAGPLSATAKTVSNILISTALKKMTGISMVSELFQLGTDLWTVTSRQPGGDNEDGEFECVTLGSSASARHYFCPEAQFSRMRIFLLAIGVLIPLLYRLPIAFTSIAGLTILIFRILWKRIIRKHIPISILGKAPAVGSYTLFGLHAILPILGLSGGISMLMNSLVIVGDQLSVADRISFAILGSMSLSGALKNVVGLPWQEIFSSLHDEIRKIAIVIGVIFHLLPLLDKSGGVYVSNISWLLSDTILASSTSRSLHYISVIISSNFQQKLFTELKKREVLLRLLGAERVMVLSLTLFFRGITAAVTADSLLPYFRQVSPHPLYCCLVMSMRRYPIELAFVVAILPQMPRWISNSYLVMVVGLIMGSVTVMTLWNDWRKNEDSYLSNMRLLYILPGVVSSKTKDVVDKMLISSGKSAMKKFFINYVRKFIPINRPQ